MLTRGKIPRETIKNTSNFCTYCGAFLENWEKVIDHFIPYSYGRDSSKNNLFVSCRECNAIKSDKFFDSLMEAREYILPIAKNRGVDKNTNPVTDEMFTEDGEEIPGKVCVRCKIFKPMSGFATARYNSDGKLNRCRVCDKKTHNLSKQCLTDVSK